MYLFKKEKLLVPGDFISIDAIGATHFPTGSEVDMINSIKKFASYRFPENTYLCSSHWTNSTVEDAQKYNRCINSFAYD